MSSSSSPHYFFWVSPQSLLSRLLSSGERGLSPCYFIVCVAQRAGPGEPAPRQSRNSTACDAFPRGSCLPLGPPPLCPGLGSASEPHSLTPRRLAGQPEPAASPGPVSSPGYPRSAEEPRAAFRVSPPSSVQPLAAVSTGSPPLSRHCPRPSPLPGPGGPANEARRMRCSGPVIVSGGGGRAKQGGGARPRGCSSPGLLRAHRQRVTNSRDSWGAARRRRES